MRTGPRSYLVIALLAVGLAACGGSSSSKSTSAAPSAEAQIKQNWANFFSPSTSAAQKQALLQNGSQFTQIIKEATSNPLASQVSATVSDVTLTGPTTATVKYTILLGGKPVLKDATGTAIKSGNNWVVGDVSFCQLLKLEGASSSACPKA